MPDPDPVPAPDPIPPDDIRRGWTTDRFLLIIAAIFGGLATLQSKCNGTQTETVIQHQQKNTQKLDEAAIKLDTAEKKLSDVEGKTDKIRMKVGANGADK